MLAVFPILPTSAIDTFASDEQPPVIEKINCIGCSDLVNSELTCLSKGSANTCVKKYANKIDFVKVNNIGSGGAVTTYHYEIKKIFGSNDEILNTEFVLTDTTNLQL